MPPTRPRPLPPSSPSSPPPSPTTTAAAEAAPHVVTLGDAMLTTDDLALLVPPHWLNDALISFWVEHLRLHVLAGVDRVAVLPPNVSFFLSLCDEADSRDLARQLRLSERELVVLTVNDSQNVDMSGRGSSGSHWSLLVYLRASRAFFTLDSLPRAGNGPIARRLCGRLCRLLSLGEAHLFDLPVPTQENMYDCGAFVCMFAEDVIRAFLDGKDVASLYGDGCKFTADVVESKRQEIGKLACRLLDEQQRKETTKARNPAQEEDPR